MKKKQLGFETKQVHAGHFKDAYGSVAVPIYQTSTFEFIDADHGAACFAREDSGYIYSRIANPTIKAFEDNIASLENGYGGIATSSGMGAATTIYMALLGKGQHIVSTDAIYGPARAVIENHFSRFGVEYSYIDTSDTQNILRAIQPNTKVLYIETPANPTMQISDLKACASIAEEHNLTLVVDNTFCSPFLQNPLDLGADVVFHSITKFINGHADVVGGVIVTKTEELYKKIRPLMVNMGCNMDPHQAYMVLRGVKTLSIRVERADQNARIIADYLEKHPKVNWIKYPGLPSHPQYELARQQMKGFGSMISFGIKDGFEGGKKLMNNVQLAKLAVSLGGVESLIQHPASMTHAIVPEKEKLMAGITPDLVRLSVGIEYINDLLSDLEEALKKV
ncbi:MAG: aminotransferase class I/II-fold pyridoxal phosphate-dependent enzyme [Bacteroidales bacterium]|nr:aminotransferase class I/II-fold pyridoxal phosphate-dependent enzyme [Bacteroidales bacterium]